MNISYSIPAFMRLRKRKEMFKSVLILLSLTVVNLVSALINQTIKMANKENEIVLKFSRISEKAYAPEKGSERAAGYDLKSAYDMVIPARGKQLIPTDLKIELPPGCYGRIAPRSGLAWKNFIDVGAGVIDEDYRGNVGVVLFNHSEDDFYIKSGDRIAQLICERIYNPVLMEIKDLNNTERGGKGFGSTGLQ